MVATYKFDMTRSGVHIWFAGIRIVDTSPNFDAFHIKYSSRHLCHINIIQYDAFTIFEYLILLLKLNKLPVAKQYANMNSNAFFD